MAGGLHTHRLIRKTARALAAEFYEIRASRDNAWFKNFPNQRRFIDTDWGAFIPVAREVLVDMLVRIDVTDRIKMEIKDALVHERGLENGILIRPEAMH